METVRGLVHWLAAHSGIPVIVVAAVVLVVGWRLLKWSVRFLVQVGVVALLLLAATKLGWIVF